MRPWIVALLDPEPIEKGTKDKDKGDIATPPKFLVPNRGDLLPSGVGGSMRRSTRDLRSASPSKSATPARKMASPRKPRGTRGRATKAEEAASEAASSALQNAISNGITDTEETPAPEVGGSEALNGDVVRVEVDEDVEQNGDIEITHTTVRVEMPANAPELPLPESTEEMIAKAREMVEEANRLEDTRTSNVKALKRKADEIEEDEDESAYEVVRAKRVKQLEVTVKKERVRTRALFGIVAAAAVG